MANANLTFMPVQSSSRPRYARQQPAPVDHKHELLSINAAAFSPTAFSPLQDPHF